MGIIFTTKFKVASEDKLTDASIEKQIYNYVERSLERLKIEKFLYICCTPKGYDTVW